MLSWQAMPSARSGELIDVQAAVGAYLVLVLIFEQVRRFGRTATLWVIAVAMLLDGAFLAWCFRLLGGVQGPLVHVLVLYTLAITLLASFRSGIKTTTWNSLMLLTVLVADVDGTLGRSLLGSAFPRAQFTVLLAAMWTTTFTTAAFAAVNERELRRRRYDMQVLRGFAVAMEDCWDTSEIMTGLAKVTTVELLARRALVVIEGVPGATSRAAAGKGAVWYSTTSEQACTTDACPWPPGSIIEEAIASGKTQLLEYVEADADAWLSAHMPEAREVVLIPLARESRVRGVLVFEHAGRGVLSRLFTPGIERRMVSTAEQAAAHAALAISRAALLLQTRSAAETDALTGLANRGTFDTVLAREIQGNLVNGFGCAVALIDLDHFKMVNDTYGHQVGDAVLIALANCLRTTSRRNDLPARYGGEEFAVIMPAVSAVEALRFAERLRAAVESMDSPVCVTASIGVAIASESASTPVDLLAEADAALYEAKGAGRNRVVAKDARAESAL
ncbi:hypothetical protein GCM10009528_45470 [Kineococcus aurantiacus]